VIYNVFKQQVQYMPLYFKAFGIANIIVLLIVTSKFITIISEPTVFTSGSMMFATVYTQMFGKFAIGLIYLLVTSLIAVSHISYRFTDYLTIGTRQILFYQILVQSILAQFLLWAPWAMLTATSFVGLGTITNPQTLAILLLGLVQVYFTQLFLVLIALIGLMLTEKKAIGIFVAISLNLLLFSLHQIGISMPLGRFTEFEAPLAKLINCLSLLPMLYIISAILNAIVKGRDY